MWFDVWYYLLGSLFALFPFNVLILRRSPCTAFGIAECFNMCHGQGSGLGILTFDMRMGWLVYLHVNYAYVILMIASTTAALLGWKPLIRRSLQQVQQGGRADFEQKITCCADDTHVRRQKCMQTLVFMVQTHHGNGCYVFLILSYPA